MTRRQAAVELPVSVSSCAVEAHREFEERERLYELYARVTDRLADPADLDELFEGVVEEIGRGLGVSRCMIGLFPPDIDAYSFQYIWHAAGAPRFDTIHMVTADHKPTLCVLRSGATYQCDDTEADPRVASMAPFYRRYKTRSSMFRGLWRGGTWWGVVGVHQCGRARRWTDYEALFMERTANQIAMAIDLICWRERCVQVASHLAYTGSAPNNAAQPTEPSSRWLEENGVTSAEKRVLRLVARGLTNPEIAGQLNISRRTVECHITSMLAKLSLRNRVQLARLVNSS